MTVTNAGGDSELHKIRALYDLIGSRGLYVNTNLDVFTKEPEKISVGTHYSVPLINSNSRAYSSPLLFATLTSLLNHGTMLLTGAPGVGKTTSAELAGHFFNGVDLDEILSAEIQCNPQLTEEKIIASYDLGKLMNGGEKIVVPSAFLNCPVKILDEVNRMPADVASIIMKLVDSGKASYGGQILNAQKGPLFATANYADEGTFQLTPPFLDRFDVAVMVTSPLPLDLGEIRGRGDEKLNGGIESLLSIPDGLKPDFKSIRKQILELPEEEENEISLLNMYSDFIYASMRFSEAASDNIARATKGNTRNVKEDEMQNNHFKDYSFTYTANELSVRTVKAIPRYTKAFAWFNGKKKADLDDLKAVLPYLLWHKLIPTSKAINENSKFANDGVAFVQFIMTKIENEYNQLQNTKVLDYWATAINVMKTEKVRGERIDFQTERKIVRGAIENIGRADMPHATILAYDVACRYNEKHGAK